MSATTYWFTPSATVAGEECAQALQAAEAKIADLRHALASSRTIGVAVGILVERYKITPDAAFARLADASQRRNVKVRELAEDLTLYGIDPYDG